MNYVEGQINYLQLLLQHAERTRPWMMRQTEIPASMRAIVLFAGEMVRVDFVLRPDAFNIGTFMKIPIFRLASEPIHDQKLITR